MRKLTGKGQSLRWILALSVSSVVYSYAMNCTDKKLCVPPPQNILDYRNLRQVWNKPVFPSQPLTTSWSSFWEAFWEAWLPECQPCFPIHTPRDSNPKPTLKLLSVLLSIKFLNVFWEGSSPLLLIDLQISLLCLVLDCLEPFLTCKHYQNKRKNISLTNSFPEKSTELSLNVFFTYSCMQAAFATFDIGGFY